jgi:heme/copper-type cytochrome/quinol oxidase subunit 2
MMLTLVTGLIAVLFVAVLGLLGYGAYAFSRGDSVQPTKVSMAREVLWTGLAALLLLGLFVVAHARG